VKFNEGNATTVDALALAVLGNTVPICVGSLKVGKASAATVGGDFVKTREH
jgi:hypothetical protein